ncbi:4665_t:CDS:2, partial [Racocetra persica]
MDMSMSPTVYQRWLIDYSNEVKVDLVTSKSRRDVLVDISDTSEGN